LLEPCRVVAVRSVSESDPANEPMRSAPGPPGTADEAPFDPEDFVENPYKVELDIFEGPMDLLLYLIKKEEIDIYDIPIERITKQYMSYLDTFKLLNIGLAGEFLVMAANLCYIKSRMMLPKHVQPPEEDADEEDPRWDLIRQLIEYKKFKEAARKLGEKEARQQNLFSHKPDKIVAADDAERPLDEGLGIFDLIRAFQNILDRLGDEGLGEIVDDAYTVGDKIDHLLGLIPPGGSMPFAALFEGATTKHEMIVTFLAVLELMKLNFFRVRQERVLGEIELLRNEF
jgi:segregation and condensation protein A